MKILTPLLCLLFLCSLDSHAGLYKCVNEQGELEFSDVPCAEDTKQVTLQKDYDERGFKSEFFKNPGSSATVVCTGQVCRCGDRYQELDSDPVKQLIRSSIYLETAWINHKHARKNKLSSKKYNCKIKLHQKIFNRLYPKVLQQQVAMYRMNSFIASESQAKCGIEPESNSQNGWTSDRAYIKWYQCNEKMGRKDTAKSNRKQKKQFKRLERALAKLK